MHQRCEKDQAGEGGIELHGEGGLRLKRPPEMKNALDGYSPSNAAIKFAQERIGLF
jgi:hypothetical protein